MKLPNLVEEALGKRLTLPAVEVAGIAQDTRQVGDGFVFVARQGEKTDGHSFAAEAVVRGAVAVVGDRHNLETLHGVPYVQVGDAKAAVAKLAATFYEHPSRSLEVFGVTGTDGKTTTSFILHHLLGARFETGLLSTAGIRSGERNLEGVGHFTTPEATDVQRLLARFRDNGCSHAVLEASSHGFAQRRLDEVAFGVGVWTNLSPEHLDFHGTLEAYREAKLTLVRRAPLAILNRDDSSFAAFQASAGEVVSYGEHPASDWQAQAIDVQGDGQTFKLSIKTEDEHRELQVQLPMVGRYNVANALAALAAAHHGAGLAIEEAVARMSSFTGVPGRMQLAQAEPFRVIVDFAHTPVALGKLLQTLRTSSDGRLLVLIGAAGERDPAKRAALGRVAVTRADWSVFTEEDSRSEAVETILDEMARGAKEAGQSYSVVPDRREAIARILAEAKPGDTVVLAGKGHETTLERADTTLLWDEVAEFRRALSKL